MIKVDGELRAASTNLEPPLGQEGDAVVVVIELLRQVEAHGADLIVDPPLALVVQYGVGPVDLLELLHRLGVVRVLVWVVPQCQLPDGGEKKRSARCDQGQRRRDV